MLTPKEQQVLVELRNLDHHPTVRSLADHMETRIHRSERWSDDEIRSLLRRLKEKGYVEKYAGATGEQRYRSAEPPEGA